MKKKIFVAVTIAALGFTGFRLSTHAMASPAEPAKSPTAAIDKGRVALKNLERSLLAIIGSAKKTKGLTLYLPGKTSKDQIRRTTMETVQFVVGFDAKTGKNRKAMDAITPKITKAIDAALPTLAAAAQVMTPGHVMGSAERSDVWITGMKQGQILKIYLGKEIPAHIKKLKAAVPDQTDGWIITNAKLLEDGDVRITLREEGSDTKERSAIIPAKDLISTRSIKNRILALLKANALPKLEEEEVEKGAWLVSLVGLPNSKPGFKLFVGAKDILTMGIQDASGIDRMVSPY